MNNSRIAQRYAKSLLGLAIELGKLEEVSADMKFLNEVSKQSRPFLLMLKSPIISADKKSAIISEITKGKISNITQTFLSLLTTKGREDSLPEIINSFVQQFNKYRGIHKAKLTTALPVSDSIKQSFVKKIEEQNHLTNLQMETKVDEALIGGFVLEMDGKLIDASILRDLNDVKKQFQNNDYIHKLR